MLNRRRLLAGGAVLAGAAVIEPVRRLMDGAPGGVTAIPAAPTVAAQQNGPSGFTSARIPSIAVDGPAFFANLSAASAFQGGTVRVRTTVGAAGAATMFGRDYVLLPAPAGGLEGYISLGTGDTPGPTTIAVTAENGPFAEGALLPFRVDRTTWNVEYLEIPPAPPGESNPLDPVAIQQEAARMVATYGVVTPERYWVEPWLIPMQGVLTGYFGDQRSINGGPVGGHHGGTDLATPFGQTPGAPIYASNHGRVVLSERLIVRGNMVIIDHGGGVFTGYAHLSERHAFEGDFVAQGDLIGVEGATGLVTGAHLHWEVAVGGVLVDGLRWVNGSQGF